MEQDQEEVGTVVLPEGYSLNVVDEQILPDEATSSNGAYELPTGYLEDGELYKDVVVREITGYEEDILASTKTPAGKRLEQILQRCVVSIGPIKAEGNANWPRVISSLTVGDRLFLILKIRTVSIGAPFRFKAKCTNPECQQITSQTVSLDQFKITGLPNPLVRHWKGTLPRSKMTYTARVQTGAEDDAVTRLAKAHPDDLMTVGMMARLLDLNGRQPVKLVDLKSLTSADREYLRKDFKDHEGVIDNVVDITCPSCEHDFKTTIEIDSPSFFFPSVS